MGGEDDRHIYSPEIARMNGSDDGRVDKMTDEDDNISMNSSNQTLTDGIHTIIYYLCVVEARKSL